MSCPETQKTFSEWIDFVEIEKKPKTSAWKVVSKHGGKALGIIKWYGPWRQYCFFPDFSTLYSRMCLGDITSFIEKQMQLRKKEAF